MAGETVPCLVVLDGHGGTSAVDASVGGVAHLFKEVLSQLPPTLDCDK
jgi:hypothetical protein